jgi:predicted SAM-dependent methyltransferase
VAAMSRRAGSRLSRASRGVALAVLPRPLVLPLRLWATRALALREIRKARAFSQARIHVGSARDNKPGWVNIDLIGHPTDLAWDILRPLPFHDAEAIFAEHVLEHFSLSDAARVLRHFRDALAVGGVIRIGVPDVGAYLSSYASDGIFIEQNRPGRATKLLALQEVFYLYGHRSAYDAETLTLLLEDAGFENVRQRSFGESDIQPVPDSEPRRDETLYIEGVKPGEPPLGPAAPAAPETPLQDARDRLKLHPGTKPAASE